MILWGVVMDNATLFVSHSSKDFLVATAFTDFMISIGVPASQITCSSTPGTHIRTSDPLYEKLRQALLKDNVLFIMLLSKNYYASTVCLNEMGAAWIRGLDSLFFVLPGFSFEKVSGVIKEHEPIGISLASINVMTTEQLYDFKQTIEKKFNINIEGRLWERERVKFYEVVKQYATQTSQLVCADDVMGLCIGENKHDGCKIIKRDPTLVKAKIDFSLTKADLCTIVFPTYIRDWTQFFNNNKHLYFNMFCSSDVPIKAEIELTTIGKKKYSILTAIQDTSYCIPLKSFSKISEDFTSVREICFSFHSTGRQSVEDKFEIEISNIYIDS